MQKISIAIVIVLLTATGAAIAAGVSLYKTRDCSKLVTQFDLNQCANANYQSADRALNALYTGMLRAATDQKDALRLKESERAWIAYRDRECDREAAEVEGGSMQPMVMSNCLEQQTKARICDLNVSEASLPPKGCR